MRPSHHVLGDVLTLAEAAYAAALDASRWGEVATTMARVFRAEIGALGYVDLGPAQRGGISAWHGDTRFIDSYNTYYYRVHPYNPVVIAQRRLFTAGAVIPGHEACSERDLLRNECYTDWMRPQGVHHGAMMSALADPRRMAGASFFRGRSAGPVTLDEERILRLFSGHLNRAFRIAERLRIDEEAVVAYGDALDRLQQGVVFVDRQGRIVLMNREARRIVGEQDGLTTAHGELWPASPAARQRFRALLTEAGRAEARGGPESGGTMTVPRRSGRADYVLLVVPRLARETALFHFEAAHTAALVFVLDPSATPGDDEAVLAGAFRLTPAEARVALMLASGHAPREIAASLQVSGHTVRSHLQALFDKTGVRRQADLVRVARAVLSVRARVP